MIEPFLPVWYLRFEPRFTLHEADLATADLAPLVAGVDLVYHQAGQPGVRASWGDNFATYTSGGSFYGVAQSTDAAITGVTYASSYTTANGYYTLTLSGGSSTYASTYNIVAQAQGSQANDSKCKYIEVDVSAGNFTYKSGSTSSTTTDTGTCWKK